MTQPSVPKPDGPDRMHTLRLIIVLCLVLLTLQGWTGDGVNIFSVPPNGTAANPDFFAGIGSLGPLLLWHAWEGIVLFFVGVAIAVLSFVWSPKWSVRISSILGLVMIVFAGLGGVLFVGSGFQTGGTSAQMGASFIGAYAFYFIELYYTK